MVKIAFQTDQIDVRGSCVALYDYALYNEKLLHNCSIIVVDSRNKHKNDLIAVLKFTNRFPVFFYDNDTHLREILRKQNCDILYTIKYGKRTEIVFDDIKTVVHCVFDLSEPHGDVYAAVSKTLAQKYNYPLYVPHMVGLHPSLTRENMRRSLFIPKSARVFGRHGGQDTFDLEFVKQTIRNIVRNVSDIYFVFVNTPKFDNHPHVIFLDMIVDNDDKNRFIQTCDAMIHAQSLGETFGLSIAEFSVNNKPIITYGGKVWNDHYRNILKDKALYYTNETELYNILVTFDSTKYKDLDLNCYKKYSPAKVMAQFKKVFIDEQGIPET